MNKLDISQHGGEMMEADGTDARTRNGPHALYKGGDGIPPWRNRHVIEPEAASSGGSHGKGKKIELEQK